ELIRGNLLSQDDCAAATRNVALVYHLAVARGERSYPDAFLNSVVTTRNLLDALLHQASLRRFVNLSSFSVYTNNGRSGSGILDESAPVEQQPARRGEAYTFA